MTTSQNVRASFSSSSGAFLAIAHGRTNDENLVPQNSAAYTVADPPYLSSQLKSTEWLHRYGLKSQKLTFDQILQQIGFKRVESFNGSNDKRVGAKSAGNVLQEIQNDNGDRYALTCRPEKLREFRNRLVRMLNVLRKRLTYLTSGSRRLFGMLGEPSVCLVCDCKTTDHRVYNQFQMAITGFIREQISKIKRFNIIWVTNDYEIFQEQPIDVTTTTIDDAVNWVNKRKNARGKISISTTCEAILKAFTYTVHSIYLISEGNSSDAAREILRDNIVKTRLASSTPIPVHVVSLFCQNNDTELFLRSISQSADGNYYSQNMKNEISNFKTPVNSTDLTRMKLQSGANALTAGLNYPIDVSLMYKEINECQNIIDRLDKILGTMPNESEKPSETTKSLDALNFSNNKKSGKSETSVQRSLVIQASALFNHDENDMATVDWLKVYGVDAQKLDFYSALKAAAIRHCDGIVEQQQTSDNTPASTKDKAINAKYCDQFAHVTWPDGTIRHVYVTPEIHRDYERRMKAIIEKIKARLSWLKKGSRDVFGTILEKNVYILIDTSKSMTNHMSFVKEKLRLLIQDQLLSKERVNMASFNSVLNPWRDSLTRVNDLTIQSQLQPWIDGLHAEGSTNTLSAIRFALADAGTEGIYLLTDGRPDQNERYILSQVQYRQMTPIHTIAFNCQDQNANQFLFDLAKATGGRFHAFNYGPESLSSIEVPESEDITYLKQEIIRAEKELQRVADLRDACMNLAWSRDNIQSKYKNPPVVEQSASFQIQSHSTLNFSSQTDSITSMSQRLERPKSASVSRSNRKQKSKSASRISEEAPLGLNPDGEMLPTDADKRHKSMSTLDTDEDVEQVLPVATKKKTPYDQVTVYLKKNSLVSKGLTIFDVLQPTSVTVRDPKHIQVIDRYVLAKVWDDILPLTYGSYANKFRLVNHYAVDLEKYEMKLRELLVEYHQFTSKFIWNCLSDEIKRKLGPKIYWLCLSDEVRKRYAREITKEEHEDEKPLEYFVWRKLTKDEQENLLKKPPVYQGEIVVVLKAALQEDECQSGLQGVARMEVEIKRAIKFLQISSDLRQHQRRSETESKQPVKEKKSTKSRTNLKTGQRVYCRYDADGYYYPGTVKRNRNNRWIVLFDMEIEQEISGHVLLPMNSNNQLNLFLQDRVLVRQFREDGEYWVPGVVLCLPSPFALPANLYKIQVIDSSAKQIYVHRNEMIRINFELFQKTVFYIQNINRGSGGNGPIIIIGGGRSSPSQPPNDFTGILEPLKGKIDNLSTSLDEHYNELRTTLDDQTGAIRVLQGGGTNKKSGDYPYKGIEISMKTQRPPTPPTPPPPPPTVSYTTLKQDTEVYAVWADDDGLVYKGTIVKEINPEKYEVKRKDFPGVKSKIPFNDIFLYSVRRHLRSMKVDTFGLVKYPGDSRGCYCPCVIRKQLKEQTKVCFYDCCEVDLNHNQYVIPILKDQFEKYTQSRIDKELSLVNQVIVGFNEERRAFMLGTIIKRCNTGHRYLIKWFNKDINEQEEEHLFGAHTRRDQHEEDGYVLAMDVNDNIYKPAKITSICEGGTDLIVQFRNLDDRSLSRPVKVPATTTFAITENYLNTIKLLRE